MRRFATIGVLAALAYAGVAAPHLRPGDTFDLVILDGDTAEHGEDITFDVATSRTDQPAVNVRCYQGTAFVYDGWESFYDAAWSDQTFTLDGPYWPAGAAECDARLVMFGSNGRLRTLASLSFLVGD